MALIGVLMNTPLVSKKGLLGLCIASAMTVANADTDNANTDTKENKVQEVLIWGTQVKASSLKLDEESIAIRQADHLGDLLRTVPGVDVGGAHSLNQRITIRSMDDKDLRISIDGANQNTYMYHHMGNLQIHADILQAVEIDVGRNSVVDGGLGGAVRFETRDAADLLRAGQSFGARGNVSLADNGANSYSLSGYGQFSDAVDFLLYYNAVDKDDFQVGGGKILDENGNEVPNTDGEVRGLAGDVSDALIKVGWNISDNQRVKLGYEYYEDEGDYSYRPDMGLATDTAIAGALEIPLTYPTEFSRGTTTLNYELTLSHTTLKAAAYQNVSTFWRDERGLASWRPAAATINEGEAINQGLNILAESRFGGSVEHELTYGIDAINYKTNYSSDSAELADEWANTVGLFIEDRIAFTNGIALIPGLRYQNDNVESHLVDDTFDDTQLALAIEYEAGEEWLLRASATEIFKSPELAEVFIGAGMSDTYSPDIEAETGVNTELSLAYRGERWSTGVTVFNTQIDNYMYDYSPSKDNVGDMTIQGFETYAEFSFGALTALLTLSSAKGDLDAFEQYAALDGAGDSREQGDTVSLNVDYEISAWDMALHWDVLAVDDLPEGNYLDSASLTNRKEGFVVHNLSGRWTPAGGRGLAITLGVDNVFDEYYASQSSRQGLSDHPLFGNLFLMDYEPGRNVKASVSYQF